MIRFIIALIATLPLTCSAEIYKWKDDNGGIHFGDKPKDNAELLSIKTAASISQVIIYSAA